MPKRLWKKPALQSNWFNPRLIFLPKKARIARAFFAILARNMNDEPTHVWYISYGSNLLLERFLVYILGGTAPGGKRSNPGCRDQTPPLKDRAFEIPARLYFGGQSVTYDGGVAFIDHSHKGATTKARGYLVSLEQFWEITTQENSWQSLPSSLPSISDIRRRSTLHLKHHEVDTKRGHGKYSRIVYLGEHEGHPMLSFTAARVCKTLRRPSPLYLQTIVHGLRQSHQLSASELTDYLHKTTPNRDHYTHAELAEIVYTTPPQS